jgi:glutamine phosphoribosylpyrophosphate amidotransferase
MEAITKTDHSIKTECGLIGVFTRDLDNTITNQRLLYDSLANIQHRGQDSFGYVLLDDHSHDNGHAHDNLIIKETGLLHSFNEFTHYMSMNNMGQIFLGHMRYSTNTLHETPDNDPNIQPIEIFKANNMYLAHNGNLPQLEINIPTLKEKLKNRYSKSIHLLEHTNGLSDTYLFKKIWDVMMYEKQQVSLKITLEDVKIFVKWIINNIPGAYSCILTFQDTSTLETDSIDLLDSFTSLDSSVSSYTDLGLSSSGIGKYYMIGFRDRYGYKPLSIGKIANQYCFFSETVQIPVNGFIKDVEAGEIWLICNNTEPQIVDWVESSSSSYLCSMEPIYFMKKDSLLFNGLITVDQFRIKLGSQLAKQDQENKKQYNYKLEIVGIPESAISIAKGYAHELGLEVNANLILKVENIRSFIESTDEARQGKLKRKFAFNIEDIKRTTEIILIDDSLVRGNTMKYLIETLYEINPSIKIHVRIACPKLIKGCHFGIDLYENELLAIKPYSHDLSKYFNIASIMFLDIARLTEIFEYYDSNHCTWCYGEIKPCNIKVLEW